MSRSRIAGVNAYFRAKELQEPSPILLDEDAPAYVEHDPMVELVRLGRFLLPPLYREIERLRVAHCVRHRTIDERVRDAIEVQGFRQVVLVGAGYDTRARRIGGGKGVRFFELDHPATQARRLRKQARAGIVDHAVRRSIDLSVSRLGPALAAAGFDPDNDAIFVFEGLIHYLSAEAFEHALQDLTAGRGRRRLVGSFIRSDMVPAASSTFRALLLAVREIPWLYFEPDALADQLSKFGLRSFARWDFAEQVKRFAPIANMRPIGVSQDVFEADSQSSVEVQSPR